MLNVVRKFEGTISNDTYNETTSHLRLTGANWRELSSIMWPVLGHTLSTDMVESREALAGGEAQGRNGFEIWRKLLRESQKPRPAIIAQLASL